MSRAAVTAAAHASSISSEHHSESNPENNPDHNRMHRPDPHPGVGLLSWSALQLTCWPAGLSATAARQPSQTLLASLGLSRDRGRSMRCSLVACALRFRLLLPPWPQICTPGPDRCPGARASSWPGTARRPGGSPARRVAAQWAGPEGSGTWESPRPTLSRLGPTRAAGTPTARPETPEH